MTDPESARKLQELLAQLDATLGELEASDDSEAAVDRLATMADLAREVQTEVDRLRRESPEGDART
jgi:hypothetical protein